MTLRIEVCGLNSTSMTYSANQWEPRPKREARRQEMFSLVEQWLRSGESQRNWCDLHGLHLAKFQYWFRKFRAAHAASPCSTFINLLPVAPPVAMIELHFPSGVVAKLPELVGKNWTRNWGFLNCNRCPEHAENSARPSRQKWPLRPSRSSARSQNLPRSLRFTRTK